MSAPDRPPAPTIGPAFIPRDTDENVSDGMPSAGRADWREEAEWWQRTCEYWRAEALRGYERVARDIRGTA